MRVSEIVPLLADLIERSSLPRSAGQLRAIAHLKAIPDYLARRRLDEWESDLPPPSGDDHPITASLLDAVYELGRYNLYTQFNSEETLREYATIAAKFLESGLSPP